LLAVAVGVIIAWKSERVLSMWFTVSSIVGGGLAGLFLLAFLSPRANKPGVLIGIVTCLAFTTYATLTVGKDRTLDLGAWNFPWASVMIGVVAHVLLLVVGYLASLPFASTPEANRAMTLWGWLDRLRAERAAPKA
jgi:SSS family solute:Na+ symporter